MSEKIIFGFIYNADLWLIFGIRIKLSSSMDINNIDVINSSA